MLWLLVAVLRKLFLNDVNQYKDTLAPFEDNGIPELLFCSTLVQLGERRCSWVKRLDESKMVM